uniref:Uncharacterized protein n=1 Tax=Phlegmariurus squarrosus TaxID=73615 RepID=H9M8A9_PHLSQ|nr:hypothetical protein HusqMp09 [Phlegmariurus squarrosus]AEV55816.1 hypothetical protein HusqMp09 [Phlegmariurus squarrosus]
MTPWTVRLPLYAGGALKERERTSYSSPSGHSPMFRMAGFPIIYKSRKQYHPACELRRFKCCGLLISLQRCNTRTVIFTQTIPKVGRYCHALARDASFPTI